MIENAFDATVHVVHDYRHALAIVAEQTAIELCLLDLHIPGDDARAGIAALQASLPDARMVVFSGSAEDADLMLALDLKMHGFLPKSSSPPVVEAALRLVMAGGVYLPSGIGELALRNAGREPLVQPLGDEPGPAPSAAIDTGYGTLSDRQLMVLQYVAVGRSNKEIARELAISPATVKAHVANIIAVLGASNRIEAASRARALGLIDPA
jgi:DNA-binding NarL/FixJ family response regulator